MFIVDKWSQPEKTWDPNDVEPSEIFISERLVQSLKAEVSMVDTPFEKVMLFNCEQFSKVHGLTESS